MQGLKFFTGVADRVSEALSRIEGIPMREERPHHGDQPRSILALVQIQATPWRLYKDQRLDMAAYTALNGQLKQRTDRNFKRTFPLAPPGATPARRRASGGSLAVRAGRQTAAAEADSTR